MADFNQALKWMEEGKKVTIKHIDNPRWHIYLETWPGSEGFIFHFWTEDEKPEIWVPHIDHFNAKDWELFKWKEKTCCKCGASLMCNKCKMRLKQEDSSDDKI